MADCRTKQCAQRRRGKKRRRTPATAAADAEIAGSVGQAALRLLALDDGVQYRDWQEVHALARADKRVHAAARRQRRPRKRRKRGGSADVSSVGRMGEDGGEGEGVAEAEQEEDEEVKEVESVTTGRRSRWSEDEVDKLLQFSHVAPDWDALRAESGLLRNHRAMYRKLRALSSSSRHSSTPLPDDDHDTHHASPPAASHSSDSDDDGFEPVLSVVEQQGKYRIDLPPLVGSSTAHHARPSLRRRTRRVRRLAEAEWTLCEEIRLCCHSNCLGDYDELRQQARLGRHSLAAIRARLRVMRDGSWSAVAPAVVERPLPRTADWGERALYKLVEREEEDDKALADMRQQLTSKARHMYEIVKTVLSKAVGRTGGVR